MKIPGIQPPAASNHSGPLQQATRPPGDEKGTHMLTAGDRFSASVERDDHQETRWQRFVANFKGTITYPKLITFPNLKKPAILQGRVVSISSGRSEDGDIILNVVPNPEFQHMLYYKGKKRPYVAQGKTGERYEAIHNEVKWFYQGKLMPQIQELRRLIKEGKTPLVETYGDWTFDWIHEGWVEMHPVRQIKILAPDAP